MKITLTAGALSPVRIQNISVDKMNIELADPFPIASDHSKVDGTSNVLVTITADDGIVGHGEGAPFAGISHDSQSLLIADIKSTAKELSGKKMTVLEFERRLHVKGLYPAARAALEMAFLDIIAKRQGVSIANLLNPYAVSVPLVTDITIPIVVPAHAKKFAGRYARRGFKRIKIKVGDHDVAASLERIKVIQETYERLGREKGLEVLIDANEGFTPAEAIALVDKLLSAGLADNIGIFEQPVARVNIKGLKRVRQHCNKVSKTLVFADESVYSLKDARKIIKAGAADGVNLKLMKQGGLLEAWRIAMLAKEHGIKIMIGGMVESELAMGASAQLAQAIGDVHWIDLDMPLLLRKSPIKGGLRYNGPKISVPKEPGLGVTLRSR